MATESASDAIAELSLQLLDLYRATGLVRQRIGFDGLVGWSGNGMGVLAKLSGQPAEAIEPQLSGVTPPTPGQARALCRALRLRGEAQAEGTRITVNGKAD